MSYFICGDLGIYTFYHLYKYILHYKNLLLSLWHSCVYHRCGHGSKVLVSTLAGFCIFFWNWSWSQKFLKNKTWIQGQFIFSAAAGVCVVFINVIGNAQIGLHHVQSFSTERH